MRGPMHFRGKRERLTGVAGLLYNQAEKGGGQTRIGSRSMSKFRH
jgi:hypothetical protein